MKLYLRDRNPDVVAAWKRAMPADVDVSCGDIFDGVRTDAIVSPANSFGVMNGGIDWVYSRRWPCLQQDLQDVIKHWPFMGEVPVGQAVIVKIKDWAENRVDEGDPDYKWLVSAPTMRVPMDVQGTVNAYLAFRAALLAVRAHDGLHSLPGRINSLTCPGLGTAVGGMPSQVCAIQMAVAWRHVMHRQFESGRHFRTAEVLHQKLVNGDPAALQE